MLSNYRATSMPGVGDGGGGAHPPSKLVSNSTYTYKYTSGATELRGFSRGIILLYGGVVVSYG